MKEKEDKRIYELNNNKNPPSAPPPEPGVGINVIINRRIACAGIICQNPNSLFPKALYIIYVIA